MNILVVNVLFIILNPSILVSPTTAAELGESACSYLGFVDLDNVHCHKDAVKLKYLPEACTSYVIDGVTCTPDLKIVPNYREHKFEKLLQDLVTEKPSNVFIFYKQSNMNKWSDAIFKADHSAEAQQVEEYVKRFPIGGLILCEIETPILHQDCDFYEKLAAYVKAFKTKLPNLKIGFYLKATDMLCFRNDSNWFDFNKMNTILDFYLIEFISFNECIDGFLHSGITPLESKIPGVNTLNNFAEVLNASTIAKDKVYFELLINPKPKEIQTYPLLACEVSYNEYCENNNYDSTWCVDNQDTLYEKGQFAKQYAKGFVAKSIDLIDRDLKCKCNEDKYITFNMLLNGFNGAEKITCDRLKG